ncbi:MAG: helix-turn-helix domain-containing protein [Prevotella sp.]|jgi:AraC-like DNA-binding protein
MKQENSNIRPLTLDNMSNYLSPNFYQNKNNFFLEHNFGIVLHHQASDSFALPTHEPLQTAESRIGYITAGEADYNINMVDLHVQKGDIIMLSRGTIIEWEKISPDFQFNGFAFSDELCQQAFGGTPPPMFNRYMTYYRIQANEQYQETLKQMLQAMWDVTQLPNFPRVLLESMVKTALIFLQWLIDKEQHKPSLKISHEQQIFNDFLQLVNLHAAEQHNLPFYADKLCLTPRYFSNIVKKVSGLSGKEWIDRALIVRAKVMLRHSDKQIAQISDSLGFPNCSLFCRFFRSHTGMSPGDYRTT